MEANNTLSRQFKAGSLLRYAMPSVFMMMIFSMYSVVDGMFISKFVSTDALAGLNIVFPITNLLVAICIMIAHGGNAIISKYMGEGDMNKARQVFTALPLVALGFGGIIMLFGLLYTTPIAYFLGANEATIDHAVAYGRTMLMFVPFSVLQMMYQTYFVTAGKPHLGLILTLISGVTNVILDYVFIIPCNMGIAGAALATCIGQSIPAIFGTLYFLFKRNGTLYYVIPKISIRDLMKTLSNGSSEMLSNISVAITTFMFNIEMREFLGEDGIAAVTIIQYTQFLLTSLFMGYSAGVAPVVGYKYGANDRKQQKVIFKISMIFIGVASLIIFTLSMLLRGPLTQIFAEKGSNVYNLATYGFLLFAPSYLFVGYNIFASAYFTAFSNGFISALLSFMRTLLFLIICLIVLPLIWKVNGVWLAVPVAEGLAIILTIYFLIKYGKRYGYSCLKKDNVEDVPTNIDESDVDNINNSRE